MELFSIETLFVLVKHAVDKADLESLRPVAPANEYKLESREISEYLCDAGNAITVDDLTAWLRIYWTRQFAAIATEEWLASRDFRRLAEELIKHRKTVDSPAAHARYLQWRRARALGCDVTNEELLAQLRLWTGKLMEQLYRKRAPGSNCTGAQTEYQHATRQLRQIAGAIGHGETRRVMMRELLEISKADARGFLVCIRNASSWLTGLLSIA